MMNSAIERLLSLRVGDVMSREVVQISLHQTMDEAAAKFTEHAISGAPVIDESGHCVGILSSADFVRRAVAGSRPGAAAEKEHILTHQRPEGPLEIEDTGEELVSTHMSRAVQAVSREVTLLHAARQMCVLHVHRLPVLDEKGHTAGVISSLDIVAALVQVIDE